MYNVIVLYQHNLNLKIYWPHGLNLHTLLEPVGGLKKMNWLNCDMEMKIHAICDAKKVILKYFVLALWKFAQIWAFFSCTENFSKTKNPKKCFYSIIAQKNLNANFWKHVILIKSSNLGKFPHIQAKIFQDCIFCITNCMNFHTHVIF